MSFKPACLATAIGSMPHTHPKEASYIVLQNFKGIPFWPQLPKISFKERMYVQYTEGMPGIVVDCKQERVFFDTSKNMEKEMEIFYEKYLTSDIEAFAIGSDYAQGFYAMLKILKDNPPSDVRFLKGQITGPVSLGLTLCDQNKKPSIYQERLIDAIVKTLSLKAKWQEKKLKEAYPGAQTIIFIDEPYLSSLGSAYVSLDKEQILGYLNEVIQSVEGLSGIHCCGNTDWSLLMQTQVDVISFDAYDYAQNLSLYPKQLKNFLRRGGILAWGIVPSSLPNPEAIVSESVKSLTSKLEQRMQLLVGKGFSQEELLERCLITPNCGTGSMSVELAEKTLKLTKALSDEMRLKYFG